jgi:hypothetical protein
MVSSERRLPSINMDNSLLLLLDEIVIESNPPSPRPPRILSTSSAPSSSKTQVSDDFNPQIPEDDDDDSWLEDEIAPELKRRAAAKSATSLTVAPKTKARSSQFDHWITVDRETGMATEELIHTQSSAQSITGMISISNKRTQRTINNTTILRHPADVNASLEVRPEHSNVTASYHESTIAPEPSRKSISQSIHHKIQQAKERDSMEAIKKSETAISQSPFPFTKWNSRANLDIALRSKLLSDFPEDARSITRIAQSINIPSNALHVFIDFSNIYIGFIDKVRRNLDVERGTRLSSQYLSIDIETLVAILHRGRPTQRRILSGSKSSFHDKESFFYEEFEKTYGYNVEQLTRHLAAQPQVGQQANSALPAGTQGNTQVSNARVRRPSPEKQVVKKHKEQGVDESLHTQILASLLDFSEAATIVLATGDGAQSTFQTGFAECIKRALSKGWSVELVSWSHSRSNVYQKAEWRDYIKQGRFKIINLDEYVDFLLGLSNNANDTNSR